MEEEDKQLFDLIFLTLFVMEQIWGREALPFCAAHMPLLGWEKSAPLWFMAVLWLSIWRDVPWGKVGVAHAPGASHPQFLSFLAWALSHFISLHQEDRDQQILQTAAKLKSLSEK